MRNRYLIILSIILFSCSKNEQDQNDFLVTRKSDTLGMVKLTYDQDYEFYNNGTVEDIILTNTSDPPIKGEIVLGFSSNENKMNQFFSFIDSGATLDFHKDPKSYFLLDEYDITNYDLHNIESFTDTTNLPNNRYILLAAIDKENKDTLLYQEIHLAQKENKVLCVIKSYETNLIKEEMENLWAETGKKLYSVERK
ncbi:MAG: hypothetical protein ACNS60_19165 [Candidatus Cyclobacteriaceae bacterium M2_1C_046]